MTVLGRILQAIGWIWLALGFFGPAFDLPIQPNIFPGIIILFLARILRSQGQRSAPEEPAEARPVEQEPQPRALNTERIRTPETPSQKPPPSSPVTHSTRAPSAEARRQEMLEQILVAGTDLATEAASPEPSPVADEEVPATPSPMSSAEMIAQARKRWNKRP